MTILTRQCEWNGKNTKKHKIQKTLLEILFERIVEKNTQRALFFLANLANSYLNRDCTKCSKGSDVNEMGKQERQCNSFGNSFWTIFVKKCSARALFFCQIWLSLILTATVQKFSKEGMDWKKKTMKKNYHSYDLWH